MSRKSALLGRVLELMVGGDCSWAWVDAGCGRGGFCCNLLALLKNAMQNIPRRGLI